MNNANMINVFDAVTGGIDGSASVDDWREMSQQDVEMTAEGMADNYYEAMNNEELQMVTKAIIKAQGAERDFDFREARNSLDSEA